MGTFQTLALYKKNLIQYFFTAWNTTCKSLFITKQSKKIKMKKQILILLILAIGTTCSVQAQKAFRKGNILLSPAVGVGHNYHHGKYNSLNPSFFFSADFGVHDYVSVGPYAGATFFHDATGIDFGGRVNFHWWQLLDDKVQADLKQNQLDIYATLWVGSEFFNDNHDHKHHDFDVGFTQGIRWYPNANKRFAIFGEFGYTPIAFANLGATFKIGKNK